MPLYRLEGRIGSDTAVQGADGEAYYDQSQYGYLPEQENMTLIVADGKIVQMNYDAPLTVTGTENGNVQLLPFEKIQQRFREQIFRNFYVDEGDDLTLRLTNVTLSMMRVLKKDSPGEYYLLPVWDFTGYDENELMRNNPDLLEGHIQWWAGQSMMTINALDGSLINRQLGY